MADLKGEGAFKGVNLVAKTFTNNASKDGKHQYLDVQVDARDARGPGQTNLHLVAKRQKMPSGEPGYNNSARYTASQYEAMQQIAGPNTEPIVNEQGQEIGKVMCFKADLMKNPSGPGLLANTQTLAQADFRVDDKTMDGQFESMAEAKATRVEAKANEPEVQEQAEAPVAAVEEPALG